MNKIVITGASSEIGLAICKRIISKNDEAILHYFNKSDKLITLYGKETERIKIIQADFTKTEEIEKFIYDLNDVDILINIAAVTRAELLVNLSHKDIMDMINVNILAMTKICRKVIQGMVAQHRGSVVNISSVAAQRANRGQTVYAGTKGYIESFTRAMAAEYGRKGVRINAVAPGPIESGSLKDLLGYAEEEVKQNIVSTRLGTPEDIAFMVAYLCNEQAAFINGKIFAVDGGFLKGL